MKFNHPPGATPIDPDEAQHLIPSGITTLEELNEFEQRNITKGTDWAIANTRLQKDILTINGLKRLHKRMFEDVWKWAGQFRGSDKTIGIHWPQITEQLKNLCDDITFRLKNDKPLELEEIAIAFHHRLSSSPCIHSSLSQRQWSSRSVSNQSFSCFPKSQAFHLGSRPNWS